MNFLFRFQQYIRYQWKSKTKYYLHSPFVYQFYLKVFEGNQDKQLQSIYAFRKGLRDNLSSIVVEDFGTGKSLSRTIAELECKVAVKEKYGELLYRLVKHFEPAIIVEIGTSIGISSAYMALANPSAKIISLEGSGNLIAKAKQNHVELGIKNIEIIQGNFDETLSSSLHKLSTADLILFDGNHTRAATLQYFHQCLTYVNEKSVFVFDDIYWSKEMNETWEEIKQHPQVTLTIDVYQFGICFFRKEKLAKENFVLRY